MKTAQNFGSSDGQFRTQEQPIKKISFASYQKGDKSYSS